MVGRVTELRGRNRSRIAVVDGVMMVVPEVVKIRGGGVVLRNGERIAVLRVGPVIGIDVIAKGIMMIEAILSGGRGAPSGGR
jgi:hypothetical protein